MSARQRTKGHNWEREVARILSFVFGVDAHRGPQSRDGADAPDVVGVPGWWIECKVGLRPNGERALRQAQDAADAYGESVAPFNETMTPVTPVAIIKRDRQRPYVVMDFDDWLALAAFAHRENSR